MAFALGSVCSSIVILLFDRQFTHVSTQETKLKLGFPWIDEQMYVQQMREVLRNVSINANGITSNAQRTTSNFELSSSDEKMQARREDHLLLSQRRLRKICYSALQNSLRHWGDYSSEVSELNKLNKKLVDLIVNDRRMGTLEGGVWKDSKIVNAEKMLYWSLARNPCVQTICEIGFNAGNSAAVWLKANPFAKVVMFDLGQHPYTKFAFNYLKENGARFGLVNVTARLELNIGDSTKTVPDYHQRHPDFRCDLLSVDGGHTLPVAYADIWNMRLLANPEFNILLVDDTECQARHCLPVIDATEQHMKLGTITKLDGYGSKDRGISVFRYINL